MDNREIPRDLAKYLVPGAPVHLRPDGIVAAEYENFSPGTQANAAYFDNATWAQEYLAHRHRDAAFIERWAAAIGSWDDKVVVDVGCGPGNVGAAIGGTPRVLIGVDVSAGALRMAQRLGYVTLLADAHALPLVSGFADIVVSNAALHHCDDMARVLAESARLVKPGGILVTDHDPQLSAYDWNWLGGMIYRSRLSVYRLTRGEDRAEQMCREATETHHVPGKGMVSTLYFDTLQPLGFRVRLFQHNHSVGARVFDGELGRSSGRLRLVQRLSGIDPDTPEAALSIMCVAEKAAGDLRR